MENVLWVFKTDVSHIALLIDQGAEVGQSKLFPVGVEHLPEVIVVHHFDGNPNHPRFAASQPAS